VNCEEAQELITGLVDNELSAEESALITAHFGECAACPNSLARETALKQLLKNAATAIHAPSAMRAKITAAHSPSRAKLWPTKSWRPVLRARFLAAHAAGLAVLLVIPVLAFRYWLTSPNFPIVPGIFQSYRQITAGEITPARITNLIELKDRLTALVDGRFAPMAYDFSSMELHLVGGLIQEIAMRQVLVAVYQGGGMMIICYTFTGSDDDVPEITEIFFDAEKNVNFHRFVSAHTNAVMHREGNINCILMSQMPMPDLLRLARAKAQSS